MMDPHRGKLRCGNIPSPPLSSSAQCLLDWTTWNYWYVAIFELQPWQLHTVQPNTCRTWCQPAALSSQRLQEQVDIEGNECVMMFLSWKFHSIWKHELIHSSSCLWRDCPLQWPLVPFHLSFRWSHPLDFWADCSSFATTLLNSLGL